MYGYNGLNTDERNVSISVNDIQDMKDTVEAFPEAYSEYKNSCPMIRQGGSSKIVAALAGIGLVVFAIVIILNVTLSLGVIVLIAMMLGMGGLFVYGSFKGSIYVRLKDCRTTVNAADAVWEGHTTEEIIEAVNKHNSHFY